MNAEFFDAVEEIEKEKNIPREYMYDKINQAMMAAFRKDNPQYGDNVVISMNEEKKKIEMYIEMNVVEEVEDPTCEITLERAMEYSKRSKVGGVVKIPVDTKKFGRIAAQAAKQVIARVSASRIAKSFFIVLPSFHKFVNVCISKRFSLRE